MNVLSRTLAVLALVSAVFAGTFLSTTAPGGAAVLVGDCTPGSDWGTSRDDFAAETIRLVNAHRAGLGLQQLVVVPALQASAGWKARHMAKYSYMAHSDPAPPVARSTGERMAACGYTSGWGENIARGYASPAAVMSGWLSSPGHRGNIENPSYAGIGSGAASGAAGVFWAQTFGTSASGGAPPPPPPPPPPSPPPPPPTPPPPAPKPPAPKSPPTQPGTPVPAPPATRAASAAPGPVILHALTLTPRRPKAGRVLASKVSVLKQGVRLQTGNVFCSARFQGRPLRVLTRRLRGGTAVCAWLLPLAARGQTVSATVIVEQGRLRAQAPFRANIS